MILDLKCIADALERARFYIQLGRVDLAALEVAGIQAYIELRRSFFRGESISVH